MRERGDIELHESIAELRQELFQAQFRGGQDEVEERGRFKKVRRELARLYTILKEREKGIRGAKPIAGVSQEEG